MKSAILFFCTLSLAAAAEFSEAHTVYLMPMNHSLDQFIASRLTRMHVLQVVTDPAKADAVITDQVGQQLQDKLDDLYPPPKPAAEPQPVEAAKPAAEPQSAETPKSADAPKTAETPKSADTSKSADAGKASEAPPSRYIAPSILAATANKAEKAGYMSTFGHGRGTIFLVDVKSRQVLWSAYEKPKSSAPHELDHVAGRIVKRLKDDLSPKARK